LQVISFDGLCFKAINSEGFEQASLEYTSIERKQAKLKEVETFDLNQLNDQTWITILKVAELEKLIVSTKLEANGMFSIKSFYGRNIFVLKQLSDPNYFVLFDDKELPLIQIKKSKPIVNCLEAYEINSSSKDTLKSDWFLILHAVHCASLLDQKTK
jgi:hypothetical protein